MTRKWPSRVSDRQNFPLREPQAGGSAPCTPRSRDPFSNEHTRRARPPVAYPCALLVQEWRREWEAAWHGKRERAAARGHELADDAQRRADTTRRAVALIEDGELGCAVRLLDSAGVAGLSLGVLQQLRNKHPARRQQMPARHALLHIFPWDVVCVNYATLRGRPDADDVPQWLSSW